MMVEYLYLRSSHSGQESIDRLAQLRPVVLPVDVETNLSGQPLVDLSQEFETGLEALLRLLSAKQGGAAQDDTSGLVFGGDYYGEVPVLYGEQEIWSEAGYYWFKKWKILVRVLVIQSGSRLIFFWDSRDIWKWKPREADELEEAFPVAIPLDQITAVGEVYRPKSVLIYSTARPYVEIQAAGNQKHRFSLQADFETNIDLLRETVTATKTNTTTQ